MVNNKYENISITINNKINERLNRYKKFKNMYTEREMQYSFLIFLQGLSLTEDQIFTIYTNTTL